MVSISAVKNKLPERNREILLVNNQDEQDIIKHILKVHTEFSSDYDNITEYFDTGDIYTTSERIWNFLKHNLKYDAESVHDQTVRSPARILDQNNPVDCKHFSLMIAGILAAIQRKKPTSWDWSYRFASYNNDKAPAHVFVVVNTDQGEIWIDPVLNKFNEDKKPNYWQDRKPMALYKLSGINDSQTTPANNTQIVNKQAAISNFLVWVNINFLGIKTFLQNNPNIVNTEIKQYFAANGFPFETLINLLQ
jgi:hypothetical protein